MSTKRKAKYVAAYSREDRQKDEKSINDSINQNKTVDFKAFKRLMISDICTNTDILETGCIGDIKLDDIQQALKYPKNNWKIILRASEQLMRISPYYYRMNNFYSNMALFCWGIDLYDVKENANVDVIKKTYSALAAKLENMNLKHEFSKIMKYLPSQDIFFGVVIENSTDFFKAACFWQCRI